MRLLTVLGLMALSSQFVLCGDFSGAWRVPSGFLRVTQNASIMTVLSSVREGQPSTPVVYPVAGGTEKKPGGRTHQGNALLANIIIGGQSAESVLFYNNTQPAAPSPDFVLQPGTRILLRLTNAIDTKHSAPGDRIYLQTAAPVFLNGRLVVSQGS